MDFLKKFSFENCFNQNDLFSNDLKESPIHLMDSNVITSTHSIKLNFSLLLKPWCSLAFLGNNKY